METQKNIDRFTSHNKPEAPSESPSDSEAAFDLEAIEDLKKGLEALRAKKSHCEFDIAELEDKLIGEDDEKSIQEIRQQIDQLKQGVKQAKKEEAVYVQELEKYKQTSAAYQEKLLEEFNPRGRGS